MDQTIVEKQPAPEIVPEGQQKSTITAVATPDIPKPVVLQGIPVSPPESGTIITTTTEVITQEPEIDIEPSMPKEQALSPHAVSAQSETVPDGTVNPLQEISGNKSVESVQLQETISNISESKDISLTTSEQINTVPVISKEVTVEKTNIEKEKIQREYAFAAISSILSEEKSGPSPDNTLKRLTQELHNDMFMLAENVEDLESFESLGKRLQSELLVLQQSTSEQAKSDAKNELRSTLRELNWRNGFVDILPMLSLQEQNALTDVTRVDVSKGFSALFETNTDVTDTLAEAKESWKLHKNLFSVKKDFELKEKYQWMPEPMKTFMIRSDRSVALERELAGITMQSIGDVLKMHPDWAKEGVELFMKYIFPLLKG